MSLSPGQSQRSSPHSSSCSQATCGEEPTAQFFRSDQAVADAEGSPAAASDLCARHSSAGPRYRVNPVDAVESRGGLRRRGPPHRRFSGGTIRAAFARGLPTRNRQASPSDTETTGRGQVFLVAVLVQAHLGVSVEIDEAGLGRVGIARGLSHSAQQASGIAGQLRRSPDESAGSDSRAPCRSPSRARRNWSFARSSACRSRHHRHKSGASCTTTRMSSTSASCFSRPR